MPQKNTIITLMLVSLVSAQAQAVEGFTERNQISHNFNEADLKTLFHQNDQPFQAKELSADEMVKTEGAWVYNTIAWTTGGGVLGGATYYWTTPAPARTTDGLIRAIGSGATAGFYNSIIPIRALGEPLSYGLGALGAASWYHW